MAPRGTLQPGDRGGQAPGDQLLLLRKEAVWDKGRPCEAMSQDLLCWGVGIWGVRPRLSSNSQASKEKSAGWGMGATQGQRKGANIRGCHPGFPDFMIIFMRAEPVAGSDGRECRLGMSWPLRAKSPGTPHEGQLLSTDPPLVSMGCCPRRVLVGR